MKLQSPRFFSLSFFLLFFGLTISFVAAKTSPSASPELAPLPGEIRLNASGSEIFFENGQRLSWLTQGLLQLKDKSGVLLSQVDLKQQVEDESATEALGLGVEETDLGGSRSGKSYLKGKKQTQGKRFDETALAGKSAADVGQESRSEVQGIQIISTDYPNGSSLLQFLGAAWNEKVYFDRRKSFVYSEQVQTMGAWTYTLQQWAEGSFLRSYKNASGELRYQYDPMDASYRYTFFNAKNQKIASLFCRQGQCQSE